MLAKALTKRKIKAGSEWVEQDLSLLAATDGASFFLPFSPALAFSVWSLLEFARL